MSELEENEMPSIRRLQARAAKSAILRAQKIYDKTAASDVLDSIEDLKERDQKAKEFRHQADEEMKELADRLSELIPTDLSLDDRRNTQVQQFSPKEFVRTSSNHQYVLLSPLEDSQVIRNLLGSRKQHSEDDEQIDYLNPSSMGENGTPREKDEEFLDEWLKQSEGKLGSDGDENGIKTWLA